MITSHIFSIALVLPISVIPSASLVHHTFQSMRSNMNIASSLRRSSRLTSSPYFNGAATQASPCFSSTESTSAEQSDRSSSRKTKKSKRSSNESPVSSKKTKVPPSNKAATVERTQSFEPAWWGNVLVKRTQSTLVGRSTKGSQTIETNNYPPVHTLILGTHPSIASLSTNQFYGHQQNAFWYLVGDSLGFRRNEAISPSTNKPFASFYDHLRYGSDRIISYDKQLETLVSRGFALWDIVQECERKGSLDTDIKLETPNPIREFCEGDGSTIKRIVIANGTTGAKFFVRHFREWFTVGGIVAAKDDLSQQVFKSVMNSAKKAGVEAWSGDGGVKPAIEVVCLPGVSPAAASIRYVDKRSAWEKGCFEPGLSDFEDWKKQTLAVTPSKRNKNEAVVVTPTSSNAPVERSISSSSRTAGSTKSSPNSKQSAAQFLSSDIAKLAPENNWVDLKATPEELRPSATLTNGQCFNWMVVDDSKFVSNERKQSAWGTHDAKEWIGPLGDRVLSIRETQTTTQYRVLLGPTDGASEDLLKYFRLETPLAPLYKEWSANDKRLAKIAAVIPGCRILRQDPIECMFSFICSSNNNIPRITKMLSSFRKDYGEFMMTIPTQSGENHSIYSFPTLESLSSATEDDLRSMGLGYRAKYITETRDLLVKCGGNDYLLDLRTETDGQVVQENLIQFSGIGRKVADCIALFSLDQDDAIPVDVHVQHIASRDYDPTVLGGAKSITPTIYKQVGDLFRTRFPSYAGWAHSLLFVAELPSFRDVLPDDIVQQMDEWREHEQRRKQESKKKKQSSS